jgi:hypothetical protein
MKEGRTYIKGRRKGGKNEIHQGRKEGRTEGR